MKTRLSVFFGLTAALSFAAGLAAMRWMRPAPTLANSVETAYASIAPIKNESAISEGTAEAKADAKAAVTSPQAFLGSLRGLSSVGIRGRINAAIAEMSLEDARNLARKAAAFAHGGDPANEVLWVSVLERWAELDAEGLFNAARAGNVGRRWDYRPVSVALLELAQRDPEGAWKRAHDLGPSTAWAKHAVLTTLGRTDPARALALVQEDRAPGNTIAGAFMTGWLGRDPQAALRAFYGMPAGGVRSNLLHTLSSAYAEMDPEAALAWGREIKDPGDRRFALSRILGVMASADPQRVLAMVEQPEYEFLRRTAGVDAIWAWAHKSFDDAFGFAMASKRPGDQQSMLEALNENATAVERQKLLEVAETLPPSVARAIYKSAMDNRIPDGKSALEILDQITSPTVREATLKATLEKPSSLTGEEIRDLFSRLQPTSQTASQAASVAWRMAEVDPAGAVEWAESLGSADLQKGALTVALRTWAAKDPSAAAQKAVALTEPTQRTEALRCVAQAWGALDENAALAWAETLGNRDRSAALGALVENVVHTSPAHAQELYSKFSASLDVESPSANSTDITRSLAGTLTENGPQQAISWAQGLASPAAQAEAWATIAEKWAGYDAQATSRWIGTLPAGDGRDLAAGRLVSAIARDDPESAWAWALSIGDRGKRREAAARSLDAWNAYGAKDAAREALQHGGFTEDEMKELGKKLN